MAIEQRDLDTLRRIILEKSAIVLGDDKEYLIEARLQSLVDGVAFKSIGDLAAEISRNPRSPVIHQVVDALTTNETSFFRDSHPYEALKQTIMPGLIERRADVKRLNIWSAACSSGQEPLTIAMVLREHFPVLNDWDIKILATDLSTEMLERCSEGSYSQLEVSRGLPARLLVRYFEKDGIRWRAKPAIRDLIEYRQMNLSHRFPVMPQMDLVFIRNVLIYFSNEMKSQILGEIGRVLAPDGHLFLGSAESTRGLCEDFERRMVDGAVLFRLAG